MTMPLRVLILLLTCVMVFAALTIAVAMFFGVPMAALGLVAVFASLFLRLWVSRT